MDRKSALIEAEQKRCAAMLANDAAALDALIDPRLYFSHATGAVDDKPAYMAKMAAGRIAYQSIDWDEQQVIDLGDVALLTGRMTLKVKVEGADRQLDNRVFTSWVWNDGWRLIAFQSTPLR